MTDQQARRERDALKSQVEAWKAEAQWAALRYLVCSGGHPATSEEYARARRILDAV